MSDELKDFRYYADQAEQYLDEADRFNSYDPAKCARITAIAAVYATLAKAAPKSEFKYRVTVDGAGGDGEKG
jgi:hypothetical protein